MDNKFTEKVQAWLDTPAAERNYDDGALYLLKLSNNQIMYRNISRNAAANADIIEYQLRKYMGFRLASLTHEQVSDMQRQVDAIVRMRHLDKEAAAELPSEGAATVGTDGGTVPAAQPASQPASAAFREGKRPDHDSLPLEIQALYVENADLMHRMREYHLQLRNLSKADSPCPDSERYPFLKEFLAADKKYRKNWQLYDSYVVDGQPSAVQEQTLIENERLEQKNILRQVNLAKGRYKKNPSEALKQQIADLYAKIASPSETLTDELKTLGIIG